MNGSLAKTLILSDPRLICIPNKQSCRFVLWSLWTWFRLRLTWTSWAGIDFAWCRHTLSANSYPLLAFIHTQNNTHTHIQHSSICKVFKAFSNRVWTNLFVSEESFFSILCFQHFMFSTTCVDCGLWNLWPAVVLDLHDERYIMVLFIHYLIFMTKLNQSELPT